MPGPVLPTATTAESAARRRVKRIRPSARLYVIALLVRFWRACARRTASAETVTCGGAAASN
jgi:hypothetical protein